MLVKELAQTDVVTVDVEDSLVDVARTMRTERVGSVVVVDAKGVVAGVVTDRDIVVYGVAGDRDVGDLVANDIFSTNVFSVAPDAGIAEVVDKMHEEGVRRVPVVSDDGLVGIVTLDDLLCHLSGQLEELADVVRGEFPR
ncbi:MULTISPECIES: cyclic nucleotide-binding/CBS domain-containing protein [Haloferax]|uniref:CBS domain-containing protein n=1 Tax=Haloferax marinum TaxID=2666143 RepID=A0A6A8G2R9_9EURY|nr:MULTISPECIES: CBS domain-containing protein [Haloferax]KAB1196463.1 CBS domain-containing protein [Haloferax sp. CBA1150]MRW95460.1 CBS domain-containing protein [Haloferax marinum]